MRQSYRNGRGYMAHLHNPVCVVARISKTEEAPKQVDVCLRASVPAGLEGGKISPAHPLAERMKFGSDGQGRTDDSEVMGLGGVPLPYIASVQGL